MRWNPHVTVAAVVERDGRFLLVEERIDHTDYFNQPAGHWEAGETLVEAVRREVLEETAHPFEPTALVGIYQYALPHRTYLRFCFTGSVAPAERGRALDPDILAVHWLTHDEILQRRRRLRSPMVLTCLEHYLAGRRLPLSCLHEVAP